MKLNLKKKVCGIILLVITLMLTLSLQMPQVYAENGSVLSDDVSVGNMPTGGMDIITGIPEDEAEQALPQEYYGDSIDFQEETNAAYAGSAGDFCYSRLANQSQIYVYGRLKTAFDAYIAGTNFKNYNYSTNDKNALSVNISGNGNVTYDDFRYAYSSFLYDSPYIYWEDSQFSYSYKTINNVLYVTAVTIRMNSYYYSAAVRNDADSVIASETQRWCRILSYVQTDYDKVRILHDMICESVDYTYSSGTTPESAKWAHNIHGVFARKGAVCEGYAETFHYILNILGIKSAFIVGQGNGGGHAWNAVSFGGAYFLVDTTWDDFNRTDRISPNHYNYFCIPASVFGESHLQSVDGAYNYYYINTEPFSDDTNYTYYNKYSCNIPATMTSSGADEFISNAVSCRPGEYVIFNAASSTVRSYVSGKLASGTYINLNFSSLKNYLCVYKLPVSAPAVPTPEIYEISASRVTLGWKAISGVTDYCVYRADSVDGEAKLWDITDKTEYTDIYVDDEATYYYSVSARSDGGRAESVRSAAISAVTDKYALAEWRLDTDTGVFTLTGNGELPELSSFADAPWSAYQSNIKSVTIGEGLTNVGSNYFYGCSQLTSVQLPSSLKRIGNSAFENCTGLLTVTIPDNVTRIGDSAFSGCTATEKVEAGSACKLRWIGKSAFAGCTQLICVTLPSKVTSVATDAFSSCYNLVEVCNDSDLLIVAGYDYCGEIGKYALHIFKSSGDTSHITTDADGYSFIYVNNIGYIVGGGRETTLVLPASFEAYDGTVVESYVINQNAFRGRSDITDVSIPAAVCAIEENAFDNCTELTKLKIAEGVSGVDSDAFDGLTKLTDIHYGGTSVSWKSYADLITAFSECNITYGKYIITWIVNGNSTACECVAGEVPVFIGSADKPADVQYTYTFSGWDRELVIAVEDTSYTAVFSPALNKYVITWVVDGASFPLEYEYGSIPEYTGAVGKAPDSQFAYAFSEWSLALAAVDGAETYTAQYIKYEITDGIVAGQCGDDVIWLLDTSAGKLTLDGRGSIDPYQISEASVTTAPWGAYKTNVKTVVISNGVTGIGENAFYGCNSIIKVEYMGIRGDWLKVSVGDGNICLTGAPISYACQSVADIISAESKLTVDEINGYIMNINAQQNVSDVLLNFTETQNLRVVNAGGEALDPTAYVGTGCRIRIIDSVGDVVDEVTVIVAGDVSGDGDIGTVDYIRTKSYILGTYSMSGAYFEAARIVSPGSTDIGTIVYIRIKSHILGTYNLYAVK